jgi:hypothetical protein
MHINQYIMSTVCIDVTEDGRNTSSSVDYPHFNQYM